MPGEMVRFFGFNRAAQLLGVMTLAALAGVPAERSSFIHDRRIPLSRPTRFRVMADLDRFAAHLAATEGVDPGDVLPALRRVK
jgi:hypothetical protein